MAENVRIRTDLTTRLERVTKQYEAANKDKESMVIKYATSEREVRSQFEPTYISKLDIIIHNFHVNKLHSSSDDILEFRVVLP